jgi:hypothetical protein
MKWLLVSLIGMLALSGCANTRLEPVQMTFSPTPSIKPSAIISSEEDVDLDVLNKPLPELDEIEALLDAYSGTDVN